MYILCIYTDDLLLFTEEHETFSTKGINLGILDAFLTGLTDSGSSTTYLSVRSIFEFPS